MKILRQYQREAIDSLYNYWRSGNSGNALIVCPTGSGKSLILAKLAEEVIKKYSARVLVLSHVKELVKQNYEEFFDLCPEISAGIFSASLKRRDLHEKIIFANIQSISKHVHKLDPAPEIVIIDEAHLIPRNEDTLYMKTLNTLRMMYPSLRVIGLTATHFRTDTGYLHKGDGAFFSEVVYEIPVSMLIERGYLCNLRNKSSSFSLNTSGIHRIAGDFDKHELEERALEGDFTESAVRDLELRGAQRNKWLIFACGIKHAEQIKRFMTIPCSTVFGNSYDRDKSISDFKDGKIRALINVNVLTTGFNVPEIDLIAMMRPTQSPGLYVQIVGRGMRMANGKKDCLVLDYAGNCIRHGPIDAVQVKEKNSSGEGLAPMKNCPECYSIIPISVMECPDCGYMFPSIPPDILDVPSEAPVLKSHIVPQEIEVFDTTYFLHQKRGRPNSLRVEYNCGNLLTVKEWFFPNSTNEKSLWFFSKFCKECGLDSIPKTPEEFLDFWPSGPKRITIIPDGKFFKVLRRKYE